MGFTEDLRAPRAATPPRLALSGAVVLNAGHEHSQVPAAQWTARTQPRCTETADGSPPRMNTLQVERGGLLEGSIFVKCIQKHTCPWDAPARGRDLPAKNYMEEIPQAHVELVSLQFPELRGGTGAWVGMKRKCI